MKPTHTMLRDRQGDPIGLCALATRCWCTHTLGEHYPAHCIEGCPCGGSYPPRLPEGKQGFSQAQLTPSTCIQCDAKLDRATFEGIEPLFCGLCQKKLQAKVNQVARDVEFEMVNGTFGRKSKPRRWWMPDRGDLACFALGAFAMMIIHALGWWP